MPLERIFEPFAGGLDGILVAGMTETVQNGLTAAAPQLRALLVGYVVAYAISFMLTANVSARELTFAALRGLMVAAAIRSANYTTYVQDFFFTTLPNQIASALGGPGTAISSAAQFDRLWSAALNVNGLILRRASGVLDVMDRGVSWGIAALCLIGLFIMFIMWLIPRVFMAIVICMGPFLIPLYLFEATRGFAQAWISKLVGISALQLAASVLMRILLVITNDRFRVIQTSLGESTDMMLSNFFGIAILFWMGALLMFVLPSFVSIGAHIGASQMTTAAALLALPGRAGAFIRQAPGLRPSRA